MHGVWNGRTSYLSSEERDNDWTSVQRGNRTLGVCVQLANGDAFNLFLARIRTRKSQTINYSDFSLRARGKERESECVWKVFNFNYKATKKNDCFWTKVSVVPSLDDGSWQWRGHLRLLKLHFFQQNDTQSNTCALCTSYVETQEKNTRDDRFHSLFFIAHRHGGFVVVFVLFFSSPSLSHKTHIFRFMQNLFTR